MPDLTLVIDRQNRVLVLYGASVAQIPNLSQRDKVDLLIQIADPSPNTINGQVSLVTDSSVSTGSVRVTVSKQATGTGGDENTYVLAKLRESDFAWNADLQGFTGTLDLNTTQLQTYIGTADRKTAQFEVRFSKDGKLKTILPGPVNVVTILANIDEGGDPAIDVLDGTPVYAELFLRDVNDPTNPAKFLVLTNVDGVFTPTLNS